MNWNFWAVAHQEIWGRKSPSGVQRHRPWWGLGTKPLENRCLGRSPKSCSIFADVVSNCFDFLALCIRRTRTADADARNVARVSSNVTGNTCNITRNRCNIIRNTCNITGNICNITRNTASAVQSTAVHILLAWSSPVRPMRVDQVGAETRALRRTSRVGPWSDPFPAIHGGLDTANWTPWPEPTSIRRCYPGLWFVSAVNDRTAARCRNAWLTLPLGCAPIGCN